MVFTDKTYLRIDQKFDTLLFNFKIKMEDNIKGDMNQVEKIEYDEGRERGRVEKGEETLNQKEEINLKYEGNELDWSEEVNEKEEIEINDPEISIQNKEIDGIGSYKVEKNITFELTMTQKSSKRAAELYQSKIKEIEKYINEIEPTEDWETKEKEKTEVYFDENDHPPVKEVYSIDLEENKEEPEQELTNENEINTKQGIDFTNANGWDNIAVLSRSASPISTLSGISNTDSSKYSKSNNYNDKHNIFEPFLDLSHAEEYHDNTNLDFNQNNKYEEKENKKDLNVDNEGCKPSEKGIKEEATEVNSNLNIPGNNLKQNAFGSENNKKDLIGSNSNLTIPTPKSKENTSNESVTEFIDKLKTDLNEFELENHTVKDGHLFEKNTDKFSSIMIYRSKSLPSDIYKYTLSEENSVFNGDKKITVYRSKSISMPEKEAKDTSEGNIKASNDLLKQAKSLIYSTTGDGTIIKIEKGETLVLKAKDHDENDGIINTKNKEENKDIDQSISKEIIQNSEDEDIVQDEIVNEVRRRDTFNEFIESNCEVEIDNMINNLKKNNKVKQADDEVSGANKEKPLSDTVSQDIIIEVDDNINQSIPGLIPKTTIRESSKRKIDKLNSEDCTANKLNVITLNSMNREARTQNTDTNNESFDKNPIDSNIGSNDIGAEIENNEGYFQLESNDMEAFKDEKVNSLNKEGVLVSGVDDSTSSHSSDYDKEYDDDFDNNLGTLNGTNKISKYTEESDNKYSQTIKSAMNDNKVSTSYDPKKELMFTSPNYENLSNSIVDNNYEDFVIDTKNVDQSNASEYDVSVTKNEDLILDEERSFINYIAKKNDEAIDLSSIYSVTQIQDEGDQIENESTTSNTKLYKEQNNNENEDNTYSTQNLHDIFSNLPEVKENNQEINDDLNLWIQPNNDRPNNHENWNNFSKQKKKKLKNTIKSPIKNDNNTSNVLSAESNNKPITQYQPNDWNNLSSKVNNETKQDYIKNKQEEFKDWLSYSEWIEPKPISYNYNHQLNTSPYKLADGNEEDSLEHNIRWKKDDNNYLNFNIKIDNWEDSDKPINELNYSSSNWDNRLNQQEEVDPKVKDILNKNMQKYINHNNNNNKTEHSKENYIEDDQENVNVAKDEHNDELNIKPINFHNKYKSINPIQGIESLSINNEEDNNQQRVIDSFLNGKVIKNKIKESPESDTLDHINNKCLSGLPLSKNHNNTRKFNNQIHEKVIKNQHDTFNQNINYDFTNSTSSIIYGPQNQANINDYSNITSSSSYIPNNAYINTTHITESLNNQPDMNAHCPNTSFNTQSDTDIYYSTTSSNLNPNMTFDNSVHNTAPNYSSQSHQSHNIPSSMLPSDSDNYFNNNQSATPHYNKQINTTLTSHTSVDNYTQFTQTDNCHVSHPLNATLSRTTYQNQLIGHPYPKPSAPIDNSINRNVKFFYFDTPLGPKKYIYPLNTDPLISLGPFCKKHQIENPQYLKALNHYVVASIMGFEINLEG